MADWRTTAARQHGALRRGDGGLSRPAAARALRAGALVRAGRHALVSPTAPEGTARTLWTLVAEVGRPMAFSGITALWLYGVPGAYVPVRPEIVVPRHRAPRRLAAGRVQRVVGRELARQRVAQGLPVVSVPVAVRRAAAEVPLAEVVALAEHAMRLRLTTEHQLRRALGRGLVGARPLREALAVAGADSHSLWERRLARLIRDAGLPRPRRQARIGTEPTYWVDFFFERHGVAIEVDGFAVHARPDAFVSGLRRTRRLRLVHGIEVLAYAPVEIRDSPDAVVAEIAGALARASRDLGHVSHHR